MTVWKNPFYKPRKWLQESFDRFCESVTDKLPKQVLTERMEIAFYNVIDHRCDKGEALGFSPDKTCKNITDYTERFISGHSMSDAKKSELRDFTATICRIISTPPNL